MNDATEAKTYTNTHANMSRIVNVTPMFWAFVDSIVRLEYHVLQRTDLFDVMHRLVAEQRGFALEVNGILLTHGDVNGLFYDTLAFVRERGITHYANALESAINKIEATLDETGTVPVHDMSSSNDVDIMNSLLRQLIL